MEKCFTLLFFCKKESYLKKEYLVLKKARNGKLVLEQFNNMIISPETELIIPENKRSQDILISDESNNSFISPQSVSEKIELI